MKMSFCMLYTTKSLQNTKIIFFFKIKIKIYGMLYFFSMHFGFNNQFIESMRI
jgi:hypothetical protein